MITGQADWHADMKRRGLQDDGRCISISIPRDLDNVELKFLDEYWEIVRSVVGKMSHQRMKRNAVPADFGLKVLDAEMKRYGVEVE